MISVRGTVVSQNGRPVEHAVVRLKGQDTTVASETSTDAAGDFLLNVPRSGDYSVSAAKDGLDSESIKVLVSSEGSVLPVRLVLEPKSRAGKRSTADLSLLSQTMEFADQPSFTVAGVTDWTAVGGHGSDAILRTSEGLARDTAHLKPNITAEKAASSGGETHRLAGDAAEKAGDPFAAVREYQRAAELDPSEENLFAWGSELLLHRAVWQAQQVFERGVKTYPKSARMLTALGSAMFAGALYDKAALVLCAASDLDPANYEPYQFMGRVELAAPKPLPCIERKLERFAHDRPESSEANYFYAMALWKQQPVDEQTAEQVEALLVKAVKLDPHCGDAYLQLGNIASSRREPKKAMEFYKLAVEAEPDLSDAHYRLAVTYDRSGEADKAKAEFQIHDDLERKQADAVEEQRRQLKQFLFVMSGQDKSPVAH